MAWPSPGAGPGLSSEPSGAPRDEPWTARCALQATAPMVRFLLGACGDPGDAWERPPAVRGVQVGPTRAPEHARARSFDRQEAGCTLGAVRFSRPSLCSGHVAARGGARVGRTRSERALGWACQAVVRAAASGLPAASHAPSSAASEAPVPAARPIRRAQVAEFGRNGVFLSVSAFGSVHVLIRAQMCRLRPDSNHDSVQPPIFGVFVSVRLRNRPNFLKMDDERPNRDAQLGVSSTRSGTR